MPAGAPTRRGLRWARLCALLRAVECSPVPGLALVTHTPGLTVLSQNQGQEKATPVGYLDFVGKEVCHFESFMVLMSCWQEQGWAGLPRVCPVCGGRGHAMSVTVPPAWSCRPRPEHVTLLFKSVCESLCASSAACGVLSRLCLVPQSSSQSSPAARSAAALGPRGSWAVGTGVPLHLGAPQAKTQPQKPRHSRTRRVCSLSAGSQP